ERTKFHIVPLRVNVKFGKGLDTVLVDEWRTETRLPLASATSIGANRLIKLEKPITAKRLRLRIFAPVAIAVSDFGLFREAESAYDIEEAKRIGVDRSNWVVTATGVQTAELSKAIDGNAETFWLHLTSALPQQITIDMQQTQLINRFSYLPRQDKNTTGMISRYRLESSVDG